MASARASVARSSAPVVYVQCGQCNSRLGVFENEWVRLTSSYARAKHVGRHMGTDIGNKIQYVPQLVHQKTAAGCGMTDIFCRSCSTVVGQYCKNAPSQQKQYLVDNYFYKLSRVQLIDEWTSERVAPVFAYEGDISMPPPLPRASLRPSVRPRMSTRPSVGYAPRDSLGVTTAREPTYRQSVDPSSLAEMREDSILADRLSYLESRLASFESGAVNNSRSMTPVSAAGYGNQAASQDRTASRQSSEHLSVVEEQRKQITALTQQIETLNGTIQDLRKDMEAMRTQRPSSRCSPGSTMGNLHSEPGFSDAVAFMKDTHTYQPRMKALRDENRQLKSRLASVGSAMGLAAGAMGRDILPSSGEDRKIGSQPGFLGESHQEYPLTNATTQDSQLPTPATSQQPSLSGCEIVPETGGNLDESADFNARKLNTNMDTADSVTDQDLATVDSKVASDHGSMPIIKGSSSPEDAQMIYAEPQITYPTSDLPPTERSGEGGSASMAQALPQIAVEDSSSNVVPPPEMKGFGMLKPLPQPRKSKSRTRSAKKSSTPLPDITPPLSLTTVPAKRTAAELVMFSDDEAPDAVEKAQRVQPELTTAPPQLHYGPARKGPPSAPRPSPYEQQPPVAADFASNAPTLASMAAFTPPLSEESAHVDLDIQITDQAMMREQLRKEALGIKEPREKKIIIQTTEKLLNEELRELGLDHRIGTEKNTKEYRDEVSRARAERRERNKREALAKAGVIPSDTLAQPVETLEKPQRKETLQSLRRRHNRSSWVTKPLEDVTDQQNVQAPAKTRRKRKSDEIDESEDSGTGKAARAPATKGRRKTERKSKAFWPENDTVEKDSSTRGVQTRRQLRKAEIDKLDRLAEEAMEE